MPEPRETPRHQLSSTPPYRSSPAAAALEAKIAHRRARLACRLVQLRIDAQAVLTAPALVVAGVVLGFQLGRINGSPNRNARAAHRSWWLRLRVLIRWLLSVQVLLATLTRWRRP